MAITHFGMGGWCTRTVGSSGLKLKAKLGHISPAAMRRAKSFIDLAVGGGRRTNVCFGLGCPLWVINGHLQCKTLCPLYLFVNGASTVETTLNGATFFSTKLQQDWFSAAEHKLTLRTSFGNKTREIKRAGGPLHSRCGS